MKTMKKRVDVVKLQLVKEKSFLYSPRKISCPEDAMNLIQYLVDSSDREIFVVIALDTKNQPVSANICSVGSLNASIVHPREVFKMAILSNAASIIIGHNHPSGDVTPSKEDIEITKRLKEAGNILGIKVLDHVIVGYNSYKSLKEESFI